jgi:hypothetical protein
MKQTTLAAILATGLAASAGYAGESVTEHESYEKRSLQVEPAPPPPRADERSYEETTRTETRRRPADVETEKRPTVDPGKVTREKKTEETVETEDDD